MRTSANTPRRGAAVFQELAQRIRRTVHDEHANGLSGAERFVVKSVSPLILEALSSDLVLEDGDSDFTVAAWLRQYIIDYTLHEGDQVWCVREGLEWTAIDVTDPGGITGPVASPPLPHASTHEVGGSDEILGITDAQIAAANKDGAAGTPSLRTLGAGGSQAAAGNDSRLSNARTPTAHEATHVPGGSDPLPVDQAAGVGSLRTIGTGALQAAAGNDSRLSNARTPTAHEATHVPGGSDPLPVDQAAGTGSLRTLGTAATQAAAGNDGRFPQVGDLIPSAASTRAGCLLCDGSAVSRTTYAALFAAIGTTYGAGDGSTTFNVPDLRGRVPLGAGTGTAAGATAHARGSQPTSGAGGEEAHTLSTAEMPSHNHGGATGTGATGTGSTGTGTVGDTGGFVPTVVNRSLAAGGTGNYERGASGAALSVPALSVPSLSVPALSISAQGGGGAHNIMQPVSVVNWFVKT